LRANGGSPPTRRVLVVSRGRRFISTNGSGVRGLLRLSGLEHSDLYRIYYYAHY
jgi:hypothetical protein